MLKSSGCDMETGCEPLRSRSQHTNQVLSLLLCRRSHHATAHGNRRVNQSCAASASHVCFEELYRINGCGSQQILTSQLSGSAWKSATGCPPSRGKIATPFLLVEN